MTREEAKTMLPFIQAYAEGKAIESRCIKGDKSLWYDDEDPSFDDDFEYRIKPEPNYRPFKDAEECWAEMLKHQPFGWIRNKFNTGGVIATIIFLDSRKGFKIYTDFGQGNTPEDMMNSFVFSDGTPFGILEKE